MHRPSTAASNHEYIRLGRRRPHAGDQRNRRFSSNGEFGLCPGSGERLTQQIEGYIALFDGLLACLVPFEFLARGSSAIQNPLVVTTPNEAVAPTRRCASLGGFREFGGVGLNSFLGRGPIKGILGFHDGLLVAARYRLFYRQRCVTSRLSPVQRVRRRCPVGIVERNLNLLETV
jgi:hypothetical protein